MNVSFFIVSFIYLKKKITCNHPHISMKCSEKHILNARFLFREMFFKDKMVTLNTYKQKEKRNKEKKENKKNPNLMSNKY